MQRIWSYTLTPSVCHSLQDAWVDSKYSPHYFAPHPESSCTRIAAWITWPAMQRMGQDAFYSGAAACAAEIWGRGHWPAHISASLPTQDGSEFTEKYGVVQVSGNCSKS